MISDFRKYLERQLDDEEFQKELSEAAGTDQSDIIKIETGNENPALSALTRLAEGIGMVLHLESKPKPLRQYSF